MTLAPPRSDDNHFFLKPSLTTQRSVCLCSVVRVNSERGGTGFSQWMCLLDTLHCCLNSEGENSNEAKKNS